MDRIKIGEFITVIVITLCIYAGLIAYMGEVL